MTTIETKNKMGEMNDDENGMNFKSFLSGLKRCLMYAILFFVLLTSCISEVNALSDLCMGPVRTNNGLYVSLTADWCVEGGVSGCGNTILLNETRIDNVINIAVEHKIQYIFLKVGDFNKTDGTLNTWYRRDNSTDPLYPRISYAVQKAHNKNLKIIAWITGDNADIRPDISIATVRDNIANVCKNLTTSYNFDGCQPNVEYDKWGDWYANKNYFFNITDAIDQKMAANKILSIAGYPLKKESIIKDEDWSWSDEFYGELAQHGMDQIFVMTYGADMNIMGGQTELITKAVSGTNCDIQMGLGTYDGGGNEYISSKSYIEQGLQGIKYATRNADNGRLQGVGLYCEWTTDKYTDYMGNTISVNTDEWQTYDNEWLGKEDLLIVTSTCAQPYPLSPVDTARLIFAKVHNYGNDDANNVVVKFYDKFGGTENLLHSETINLTAGNDRYITIERKNLTAGEHEFTVRLDPDGLISELNENNNVKTVNRTLWDFVDVLNDPSKLGGVNFTDIKLTSILMCPADGLSTFKFVFKAKEANETEHGINATKAADNAFDAFLVGLTIPNENFWVNLHPDKPDVLVGNMTNETRVGEIMMAADLLLKKIKANEKNPCNSSDGLTLQNRNNVRWDEILNNASTNNACIGQINESNKHKITPALAVRNEIVPGSVTVEGDDCQMFIVNASLSIKMEGIENLSYVKVENGTTLNTTCLEYLNTSVKQNLLLYLVEQEKELILPVINHTVNYGDDYKELRQIYTSLALAQWYKAKWKEKNRLNQTIYSSMIDKGNITGLNSIWNATGYWNAFKKSWDEGEYHCTVNGTTYTSGGVNFRNIPVTFYNLTSETESIVEDAINTPYVNQRSEYYFGGDFYVPYPDISPVYISIDQPDILKGTQVNITAVVKNRGFMDAGNFTVKFYRDEFTDENGSHYYAIAEKNLSLLAGESGEVLIGYTFDTTGNHTVYVSVDYGNNVVESDEKNNIIMRNIYVTAPDLVPASISFNPASNVTTWKTVNITAAIENQGDANARNFTVKFYRDWFTDENGSHYFIIAEKNISLNVNESLNVSTVYTFLMVGNHAVYVEIDSGNDVPEWNESNNILMSEIYVLAPDLIPVSFMPEFDRMIVGMKTKLTARILNNGTVSAENFTVKFYYNKSETGTGGYTYYTIPNGEVNISLNPNESAELSVNWTSPVSGNHTVYVFADFNKKFYEEDETNNEIMANVNVQPVLTASPDSVEIKSKLQYSINLVNKVDYTVENIVVVSHLPVGFRYVNETAELDGKSVNVSITGNGSVGQNLTFNLLNINLTPNTFKTLVFEAEVGCDAVAGANINYVNILEYYHKDDGSYWYLLVNVDVGANTYADPITGVSLVASNSNPTYFEYVDFTAYVPNPTAQDAYINNYTFILPPYFKYAPGYSTIDGNEIWEPVVCGDYKDKTIGQVINFQNDSHGLNCSNVGIFNESLDKVGHTLVYKSVEGSKIWAHNRTGSRTGSKIKFRIQVIPGVRAPAITYVNVFYTNPFCLICSGAGGQSVDMMSSYGFSGKFDSLAIFVNETDVTGINETVNQTADTIEPADNTMVGTQSTSSESCGLKTDPLIPFETNNLIVSHEVSSFKANPGGTITQTIWVTNVVPEKAYNLTLIPILPENWTYSENVTCKSPIEIGDTCKFIYKITVPDDAGEGLYENLIKAGAVDGSGKRLFYKEIKTYFSVEKNEDAWWNTSWKYRKPVTLNSTGTLTDYQMLITLNSSNFDFSKAKADGSDIRFIDQSKELNYWIENWSYNNAKVWIKVNATGTKKIHMYYGNSNTTSRSNGTAVFELLGYFEGGSLSPWIAYGSYPFLITADGSICRGSYCAGGASDGRNTNDPYINTSFTIKDSGNYVTEAYVAIRNSGGYNNAEAGKFWVYIDNKQVSYAGWGSISRGVTYSTTLINNTVSLGLGSHEFKVNYARTIYYRASSIYAYIDNIRVRKYASQEPSVSFSSEQVSQSSIDSTYNAVNLEITSVEVIENKKIENKKSTEKKQKIKDNLRKKLNDAKNNTGGNKNKQKNETAQNLSVIIKFKDNVTGFKLTNGKLKHTFKNTNAVSAKLSPQDIEKLANESYIESIELDVVVSSMIYESVPMLNVPQVHSLVYNGSGVKVAILDTGIMHNETLFRIGLEHDFIEDDNYSQDENGHGTHVSGIVTASAPGVELMPVRVLDASGSGYASDVIAGIEWAVENGADVISLSLGAPGSDGSSALSLAADKAAASGVVVVVAAGNNPSGITSPGDARDVITVGAVDKSKNIASFSGRGPTADGRAKPDIVAPGVNIYSYSLNGMEYKSGTSQAVPFVSGISALLIRNNRTGFEIKQILMDNAEDLGFDVNAQGAGLVDAYAAFNYKFTVNVSGENEIPEIEIGGIEVLPGNAVIYNFTVENLGETPDTFGIYAEGVPAGWVNVPAALTVDARKAVNGRAVITVPDNPAIAENASYNITIYAVGRSRDKETGSVTVLATKQSVKNYAVNEIRNLKTGIKLYINAPRSLNESGECVNEYGINGQKFGEEITKKLDKAADSINKDEPLKAGEILTEISNELSKEKGRKISNEFAEYLIARIEDMRNIIK